MPSTLPSLRERILKSFLGLVALYGLVGVLLIMAFFFASGLTPRFLRKNYDSIAAAQTMRRAWNDLKPAAGPAHLAQEQGFDQALDFASHNLTEKGEHELVEGIAGLWAQRRPQALPLPASADAPMQSLLDGLVKVNEEAMFRLADESALLQRRVLWGSAVLFALAFLASLGIARRLSERLSRPLRGMAAIFRGKPELDGWLQLPKMDSEEMALVAHEIEQLWNRWAEMKKTDVEALSDQRNLFGTVIESVEDGILVLDAQERVLHVNQGLCLVLGLNQKDLLGKPFREVPQRHPNGILLLELFKPGAEQDRVVELEIGGLKRIFTTRWRDNFDFLNQRNGTLYLLQDITEKSQRERMKQEFLGVLSHEIKTPLQSLGMAAELLERRREGFDDETRMLVDTVGEDVARIRAVAQDMMQVSLVDLNSLKLRLERKPLNQLLPEWLKPFRVLALDRKISLDYAQDGIGDLWIWADIDSVKFPWVISNLLMNALRVSPEGSQVSVRVRPFEGGAQICIKDQGPGIPLELQESIFKPHTRGPAPSGFLGLGLSIAREVVEAHGGILQCHSSPGQGAEFVILLPPDPAVPVRG